MWPRICEALLALWLLVSPSVFPGESGVDGLARIAAVVMLLASLISLIERLRRAYLVTLAVSLLLSLWPFTQPPPASPMMQNVMIVGLVIAMFAVLPPDATRPPRRWRTLDHS